MNTILTRELETLFVILLASSIGLFALFITRQHHPQQSHVVAPLPTFIIPSPSPTGVIVSPKVSESSWTSSDGIEELSMKTTAAQNTSTYVFSLTNTSTNTRTPLFIQTIAGSSSMSIPFNAFSSDNTYLFLKETVENENHYFVFQTSGQTFADGKAYVDIAPLFLVHSPTLVLSDVTGWASPTLVVINTKQLDGSTGPSMWFDVPSRRFISLGTLFL